MIAEVTVTLIAAMDVVASAAAAAAAVAAAVAAGVVVVSCHPLSDWINGKNTPIRH